MRLTQKDIEQIRLTQRKSTRMETVPFVVEGPGTQLEKLTIDASGSFDIKELLIQYTTLNDNGGGVVDDGICRLQVKIWDRSLQRALTDYVPLPSISTPGRVKGVAAGDQSNVLQIPYKFLHFVEKDSTLEFELVSEHADTTVNKVFFTFKGDKYYD